MATQTATTDPVLGSAPQPNDPTPSTAFDPAAPPGPKAGAASQDDVNAAYQKYLGRSATNDEYNNWANGTYGATDLAGITGQIQNSGEAKTYAASQAANVPPPPPANNTPVTATGQIAPPAPSAPMAPQATPQAVGAQPDARTPTATPAQVTYTPQTITAPTALPASYQPDQLTQFSAPDQSAGNAQQSALMSAILTNPDTMNPTAVAQMKEQAREQALLLNQQNQGQFAQSAVANGTLQGGNTNQFRQAGDAATTNAILSGNRNADLTALSTNRSDELNALSSSSALAQDQLGRAASSYATGLAGQTAQAGLNQAGAASGMQRALDMFNNQNTVEQQNAAQQQQGYQSDAAANDAAYQRALGLATNAQTNYGQDLSAELGRNAQTIQNNQFADTLGFNYNQLTQSGNQALMQFLQQSGLI